MFDEAYEGIMALIKHLEEGADRLKEAGGWMEDPGMKPITPQEHLNGLAAAPQHQSGSATEA